jgi:putative membrane protein
MVISSAIPEEARAKIHAAIADAETRTHARFVVSVVTASDRYLMIPLLWGALAALLAGGVMAIFWPALTLGTAYMIEAAIAIAVSLLLEWRPLRLRAVPRRMKRTHAHDLAHREFAARVLAHPDHHGGLLLFVSLGERHVQLIADQALHARVGETEWNRIVSGFTAAAKRGAIADGLLGAIASCSAILERHAPAA